MIVKEILHNFTAFLGYRIQTAALEALQEASEAFLVEQLEMTNLAAANTKRVTIMRKDLQPRSESWSYVNKVSIVNFFM